MFGILKCFVQMWYFWLHFSDQFSILASPVITAISVWCLWGKYDLMLLCTFSFSLAQVIRKKKKDRKQANVEGQERKMEMISIHSDSTPDSWWCGGLDLVFGSILWWVTLFQEFEPFQKKKMSPSLLSYPNDLSVWFYSSQFFLFHRRLAGFLNQPPHLPAGLSLSQILFSPKVDGFPHPSRFREVKAPIYPQNIQGGVGSPHPSGPLTPTFPLESGLRIQLSSEATC